MATAVALSAVLALGGEDATQVPAEDVERLQLGVREGEDLGEEGVEPDVVVQLAPQVDPLVRGELGGPGDDRRECLVELILLGLRVEEDPGVSSFFLRSSAWRASTFALVGPRTQSSRRRMEGLVQPERLRTRIVAWAEEEVRLGGLPARAASVLEAMLYRGELPRGDVPSLLGVTDRHARRVVAALAAPAVDQVLRDLGEALSPAFDELIFALLLPLGYLAALVYALPAALAPRWMPGLFPDESS